MSAENPAVADHGYSFCCHSILRTSIRSRPKGRRYNRISLDAEEVRGTDCQERRKVSVRFLSM